MPSLAGLRGTSGEQAGGKAEPLERACSWRHGWQSPETKYGNPFAVLEMLRRCGNALIEAGRTSLRLSLMVLGMDFDLLQGQRGQGWCHTDTSYCK